MKLSKILKEIEIYNIDIVLKKYKEYLSVELLNIMKELSVIPCDKWENYIKRRIKKVIK